MSWARIIRIVLLLYLLAALVAAGVLIYLFLTQGIGWLPAAILGGALLLVSLIVATAALIWRKQIWVADPVADERRALLAQSRRQFNQIRARARGLDRTAFKVPWNLFVAIERQPRSSAMAELGYVEFGQSVEHKGLRVSTWTSQTSVAYRIDVADGADLSFDFLDPVLRLVKRNRPSLPLNAAFVELDLAGLSSSAEAEAANLSIINRILNVAATEFEIDVPVHVALVGLEHMPDLVRAAVLTDMIGGEAIFGGFLDTAEATVPEAVDRLFSDLIGRFDRAQIEALEKQLSPDFCASLVNAPMQLSLVQAQLRSRLATLAQPLPPRTTRLNLQSLAFVGARADMDSVDPLAQMTGRRFFGTPVVRPVAENEADSVTAHNAGLLATAYHRESYLVPQNTRYALRGQFRATMITFLLIGLVVAYAAVSAANFLAYNKANNRMASAFDNYFAHVGALGVTSDTIVDRVLLIRVLREGLQGYAVLDAQPYRRWLPNWSMQAFYREMYDRELLDGFQRTLADYLDRDIFAYNQLADGVELVSLASIEAQFFSDQEKYKDSLTDYFSGALAEQGEVSSTFSDGFRGALVDLFTLNQPLLAVRNADQNTLVAQTLSGLDTADLLYRTLMRKSAYAELIDVRQFVGPRFQEVFVPAPDTAGYVFPRAYTRAGFEQLFQDGEIQELNDLIGNFEEIIGALEPGALNATVRRVGELYSGDYIENWSSFVADLRLRDADGWGEAQILMKALTNPSENPIEGLAATLRDNTDLRVYLPLPDAGAAAPAPAPAADGAAPPPGPVRQLAPASASPEAATAYNIRTAFRPYLDAMRGEGEQQSQLDLFVTYARDVAVWLQAAAEAAGGTGQHLFEQYQKAETTNPVAVLNAFASRSELGLIRNFGTGLAQTLDDSAMEFVTDYIDRQWAEQILVPHAGTLGNAFPFVPGNGNDFSLLEFADLFGPEGKIVAFTTQFLPRFAARDGLYRAQPTFLLTGEARMSPQAEYAFTVANNITSSMFVDGKPFLQFRLRVGFMSSSLSRLALSSGVTLHQFSHGPILWTDQQWPVSGVKDSDLTLRLYIRSRTSFDNTYTGPWSWFRMVADGSASINPSLGLVESAFGRDGNRAVLQFDATQRKNPFAPGFFSEFVLPESLFDAP